MPDPPRFSPTRHPPSRTVRRTSKPDGSHCQPGWGQESRPTWKGASEASDKESASRFPFQASRHPMSTPESTVGRVTGHPAAGICRATGTAEWGLPRINLWLGWPEELRLIISVGNLLDWQLAWLRHRRELPVAFFRGQGHRAGNVARIVLFVKYDESKYGAAGRLSRQKLRSPSSTRSRHPRGPTHLSSWASAAESRLHMQETAQAQNDGGAVNLISLRGPWCTQSNRRRPKRPEVDLSSAKRERGPKDVEGSCDIFLPSNYNTNPSCPATVFQVASPAAVAHSAYWRDCAEGPRLHRMEVNQ
ncbi:hypothetical protein N658DRAFT_122057 [Parathielavia hyrcaniae]|uniref:Uncharacterized protein n=1 Tax=Parathielavia hyrcaniae TaxID=113614 RepID=A0AAN6Q8A9_9PEZI|nr:hypothetical protein N658DRAFT_122057 [Parathielavia hyrcaniae]